MINESRAEDLMRAKCHHDDAHPTAPITHDEHCNAYAVMELLEQISGPKAIQLIIHNRKYKHRDESPEEGG